MWFMAFRKQVVEHFAVKDAKAAAKAAAAAALVVEHSAFVNFQRGSRNQAKPPLENTCDHCSLRICNAKKGEPVEMCEVCSPYELDTLQAKRPGTEGKRIL
jgi:hypothetical protein